MTQKMVLDAVLINTQRYKVSIKGKVDQSWEGSSILLRSQTLLTLYLLLLLISLIK